MARTILPRRDICCVRMIYLLVISETPRLSRHCTWIIDPRKILMINLGDEFINSLIKKKKVLLCHSVWNHYFIAKIIFFWTIICLMKSTKNWKNWLKLAALLVDGGIGPPDKSVLGQIPSHQKKYWKNGGMGLKMMVRWITRNMWWYGLIIWW